MDERTDELETVSEELSLKEARRTEQKKLEEELNEKLLIGLADMWDDRIEGTPPDEKYHSKGHRSEEPPAPIHKETEYSSAEHQNTKGSRNKTSNTKGSQNKTSKTKTQKNKTSKEKSSRTKSSRTKTSKAKTSKARSSGKRKKIRRGSQMAITICLGAVLFIVVLAASAVGIYLKGEGHMTSASGMIFQIPEGIEASSDNNGRTITYEDKDYQFRNGTSNILMIGKNKDRTFSTVVANFDGQSKELRFMAVPASLLAIDYTSAMNYSDIADYVSEFLCGLPIQGYMVLDMQTVDALMQEETEETVDGVQMQKLEAVAEETADRASDDWMIPVKMFKEFQESFSTNLRLADVSYVYRMLVICGHSPKDEFTEPADENMVFQQILDTFYEEKQE